MSERVLIDGPSPKSERPAEEDVRGTCPVCGGPVVSHAYYLAGKGYCLVWECWASLGESPDCTYRRVL